MKRTVFYSIVVALWLIALTITSWAHASPPTTARLTAAAAPVLRFSPSSSAVDPGATFVVDVVVDNVVNLGGYDFRVTFDPGVVHVQNVTLGNFLASTGRTVTPLGPNIDNVAGNFAFGGFSFGTAAGPDGTGVLAQVTLQAVGSGSTALTFAEAQLTDTAAALLLPLTMTPGSVTVSGPTPTPTATSQRRWIYLPVLRKLMP